MPIAIVGLSGRFPGDATTPDRLWEMVSQGRSALSEVPKDRYNIDAFYHPSGEHQGTTTARGGHFIRSDLAAFDAPFFKITAQEAHAMDPQQRLALELSYEALENAGLKLEDISACQSIRSGETSTALVGATNLILMPQTSNHLSTLQFLSPDSKSMAFDHKANGYSRGEGVSVVVLKSLADALRDGDAIRAVVRGTAVTQDGRTPGINLPSSEGQKQLIEAAYANAGLGTDATGYFEAHGPGTPAGDPLEASAISAVFRKGRKHEKPLYIGSVKTNIGHLEATAGLAGVVKAVYALERGQIPPTVWFEKPNPNIDLHRLGLAVPTELLPWPTKGLRRASVNSFGYGGTNAHCVLDDAYHFLRDQGLSGRHNTLPPSLPLRLRRQKSDTLSAISSEGPPTPSDKSVFSAEESDNDKLSVTEAAKELSTPSKPMRPAQNLTMMFVFTGQGAQWFAMGRELLAYPTYKRGLIQAASHLKSLGCDWDLLEELHKSQQDSRVNEPQISQPACTALQVAAIDLLSEWGVFPSTTLGHSSGEIAAAYAKGAITRESAWSISYHRGRLSATLSKTGAMLAVALGEEQVKTYIDRITADPKPVIACINSPESVTLSGSEEAISEVLSLIGDQAWARKLLVKTPYHSPYMQEIAPEYLKSLEGIRRSVPSTAKSTEMYSSVTGEWIENDALRSPQYWVDNMVCSVKFKHALEAALKSTPTNSDGTVILEIGPHGALQGPIKQTLKAQEKQNQNIECISLLMRKEDAIRTTLKAAGALYQRGCHVNIHKANTPDATEEPPVQLVDLPPFPWNHNSRYWSETAKSVAYRHRKGPKHDLLGNRDEFSNESEPAWRNYLRLSEIPWLKHFEINGQAVLSCGTMLAMVVEAIREVADPSKIVEAIEFRDVFPGAGMILNDSEEGAVETKLQLRPWRSGSRSLTTYWKEFALSSRDRRGTWTQHSTGLVSLKYASNHDAAFTDEQVAIAEKYRQEYSRIAGAQLVAQDSVAFYEKFSNMGMHWGPSYQPLVEPRAGDGISCCSLQIQDTKSYMPANFESSNLIHPTALDGVFQMLMSCDGVTKPTIPKYIERIYISNKLHAEPGSRLSGFAKIQERWADGTNGTAVLSDAKWEEPLVIFEGLKATDLQSQVTSGDGSEDQAKALWKLGAYSQWHVDVENSPGKTSELLKMAYMNAPQTEYDVICDLEWAAYIVCKRTIQQFGPDESQHLAPHHQLFHRYMTRQLELGQAGKLPCQSPDWLLADRHVESEVLTRVAAASPEGKMMKHISDNISSIFLGEVEPSALISYENMLDDERTLAVQCEYISRLSGKRPLRILEVGAGNGRATRQILANLSSNAGGRLVKYTYTNTDDSSFEKAAEKFKEWSTMMEFKVFDIEKEPSQQGLEEGSYDVIVASQVLHPTSLISTALGNCRKLLKQGGHIVVTELTNKMARRTVMFGVFSDWWMGENDERIWGPELSEDQWDRRLRSEGFSGVDWSFRDRDDAGWSSSIMVSQVPHESNRVTRSNVLVVTSSQPSNRTMSVIEELSTRLAVEGVSVEQRPLVDINNMDSTKTRCLAVMELDSPLISNLSAKEFEALKRMFLYSAGTLWLTRGGASIDCRNPELNMIAGLTRTIRGEAPEARVMTLDLDPDQGPEEPEAIETVMKVFHLQEAPHNSDFEFAQRDGALHVLRVCPDETLSGLLKLEQSVKDLLTPQPIKQLGRPLKLELKSTGELDSFYFDDDVEHHSTPLDDLDVEIEVKAVGLNLQDMTIAVGQTWDVNLGIECSGVVTRTEETILIHSASDPLGQAAIQISQHIGAEVFATVSSASEKLFLAQHFGIPEDHIFSNRDVQFAQGIKRITNGKGVHVVLNSLTGEMLRQTWHCIAPFGRFIELGLKDIKSNTGLDMALFANNVMFAGVNLFSIHRMNPQLFSKIMADTMRLYTEGVISTVVPQHVMKFSEISSAFRLLQTQKHGGKVVLEVSDDDLVPDSMFERMRYEGWCAAINPKLKVTSNLHNMLPRDLDFFLCISSSSGQIGAIAQGNYNAGNTFQDAVAHHRRSLGLKGTSIDLGWMGDIGFISEQGKVPEIVRAGAPELSSSHFFAVMEAALADQVGTQPVLGLASGGLVKANGFDDPYWFSDARFGPLRAYDVQKLDISQDRATAVGAIDLATVLGSSQDMQDAKAAVCTALLAKLAKSLMMELEDLDSGRPINTYGVDSLVAVDIRAWALKEAQSVILVSDILKSVPILELAGIVAKKSNFLSAAVREEIGSSS
ncbi:putative polyketide synthase protein [Eutypa lata UCREL1]|uniref:Putative polyketide synthase protein n=1 Tax=Eutypa lata (strain UCR-EL1) TaxID=1287681 RepID=M7SS46_EUTLA|nr:putative polyketide synthase protein [Eutypa lata UCREL1]